MLPKLISRKDAEGLMTPEQRARSRGPTAAAIRWAIEEVHRSVVDAWLCTYASGDNKVEVDPDELILRRVDTVPIQRLTYALWFHIESGDDPRAGVGPMSDPHEARAKELLEAALELVSRPDPVLSALERAPMGPPLPEPEEERRLLEEALASGPGIPGEVVSAELFERGRRVVRAALERVICIDQAAFTGDAITGFQTSIHDKGARLLRLGSGPTREACQMEARKLVDVLALVLPAALTEAELAEHEGVSEQASAPAKSVPPALERSCSFCGKLQGQVQKLIAGPCVWICNECVALCNDANRREMPDLTAGMPLHNGRKTTEREQGREEGRAEGEAKGLRTAVRSLCRVLSIPLSAEREAEIDRMGVAELDALRERIERDCRRK